MKPSTLRMLSVVLAVAAAALAKGGETSRDAAAGTLPDDWLAPWTEPPPGLRPLQIVHGLDPRRAMPEGIEQMLREDKPGPRKAEGMRYYLDRGLGGVVCNVAFQDYMRSEQHWKTLIAGVRQCDKLGMVVWLYDEKGYPSGAAGSLVLEENPEFEAAELAFDASRDDPFILRPAYEHTHASNNYHAARRYANLIDDRAVRCFIAKTHDAYWQRLGPYFGRTIRAMFTDEPSLIAINIGQIPDEARKRVPVVDPVDPEVRPLPRVPWVYDLAERYQERYGEDLVPRRRSLFAGDSEEDRRVRRQFWALIADLIADRYFGALGKWCSEHGVASSGHSLWEEALVHHVALEGNGLKVLAQMDVPGLDMLSSNPEAVIHSGWMTAALPASAALLTGRRRVMTEVSDFSQRMGGAGHAALPEMQATAAWQAAWGVTDFTLYYSLADRPAETYRAYCDYVGKLNAVLEPARPTPEVLLYYPVYDLWAEYLPVAEPLRIQSQSPRAQRIAGSFMRLGQRLQRSQIPFALVDHEYLAAATVRPEGALAIHDGRYKAVVLPEGIELPPAAAKLIETFRTRGGRVVADGPQAKQSLIDRLQPRYRISPASEQIALGQFLRDGRPVLLAVNVGREDYRGHLAGDTSGKWMAMDPASGAVRPCETDETGSIPLALAARQAMLLVGESEPGK